MTCIVGIEDKGVVWMGADSAYSDGQTQGLAAADNPKLWRAGSYLIGVAGSARVANVLRFHVRLPPAPARGVFRHMVTRVVPVLRRALKKSGRMLKDEGGDREGGGGAGGDLTDGVALIAVGGKLFSVHGDFQVCRSRAGYDALGSGGAVALGALHASAGQPRDRVRRALEAA